MKRLFEPSYYVDKATSLLSLGDRKRSKIDHDQRPPKIGLALSSGGARGLAHIGVLQVMKENGIQVDAVSGSSMGAYIGAHYACGLSPSDMYEIASTLKDRQKLWDLADPIIPPVKGFFKGEKTANFLRSFIGDPDFSELLHPFFPVTFDLDTQEKLVIQSGNCLLYTSDAADD